MRGKQAKWTRPTRAADGQRFATVLDWVRSWAGEWGIACVLQVLDDGRSKYAEVMRQHGYVRAEIVGEGSGWVLHPALRGSQTERRVEASLDDYRPVEALPEHRRQNVQLMLNDVEDLKRWKAYPHQRQSAPAGRPQYGIAETVARLRALFPRQDANVPVWECVAVLARVFFSELLGPAFDGDQARDLVKKHQFRQR